MSNISIPENDNPIRTQAALGGNQKYRNMGNVSGQAYLVRGQVTHVYYQKGTLDFSPYGSGSGSSSETTDGSGSAPIPVDFWGTNTDGKVFGCYRPVKIGSQVLVAYINGDTSYPIVVGIYPDNEKGYELISPVPYNTGDDSTDSVQGDSLGEKKLYANQQLRYVSGKGDILKSMGGKSFLYISKNDSGYLDDINYAYDQISDFYDRDGNQINPTQTKAQSWLLVHEDNDSDENSDGHRTRFYLNKAGELMVAFMNKNDTSNITLLEASKDTGFKLTRRFDTSDLTEDSDTYVQLGIGNGNKVNITSVDSGDATTFDLENGAINFNTPEKGTISFNNVSVDAILGKVSDAQNAANEASDKADNAYLAGETAKSAASDAANQAIIASQAGEDAKSAAVDAKAAGEDAKAEAKDTQQRIIYYSSISNEKDVAIPGKYIIVNTDTYIKNGTIQTAHIADAAITMAKIANLAVGTAQIEDAAITQAKIGNLAVGTAQIEDAAITDAKVGTLSADHLNAGTIDFSVISGIHINASEIDVGKIVADQIYVNGLGDISKNLGTVTSGTIKGTNINSDVENVTSDVNDLNDPNLMNVIEKQTVSSQYAGLTSQYNVILARAKDDGISTTDLTTAYNNLDTFITPLLKDTTKASNIDRYTYNSLTYAYNTALSNVQSALKDAYNTDISNMQSSVSVASQAASSAAIVASQANETGNTASYVAAQASLEANQAKSAGDNAISVANTASQAASSAILAGSTATVNANKALTVASQAQIAGDNATSVANNASQAASSAILAGSTATVIANKASTVANEAKSSGDNATSVANNATSVANSARSVADSTYAYASSEISIQSTATAKAQSTADNAFSQAQAVGSQVSAEIAVQSNATAKAQSTADNAFNQAQAVGSQVSAEISSNSTATAKAQSTADNAFSQATTAIDNGKVTSQAVTDLQDGSKLTIADLENGLATKVANSDYASYKEQTASQIGQMVTNGAFSAYQQTTADLIASKVANSDFSAYQATTAKAISSKVESSDFNTYKTQTADLIDDKVSSSEYASDKTQTASEIADRVSNSAFSTYQTQTASQIAQKVDNGAFSAYQQTTADLISSKVATSDFSAYQATTAKEISSKVESSDFNTYKTQTADLIDDKVSSSEYASDKTQTASEIADRVSNSAFSTYQTQTASQIASKVDNGDFSTYKTQTADLISSKVATSDFSAYQSTTAKEISSKVESSEFNTYKTQTANMISSKVESSDFQALQTQVNNSAVGTNLLLNTSDYSNNWTWNVTPSIDTSQNPAILHYPSTTITSGNSTIAQQNIGSILQPSTTYTASFYAKGTGNFIFYCYSSVAATISSVNGVVAYSTASDCHTTIPLTSSYVRYTITFTTLSSISGSKNFLLRQDYNSSDTSYNTVEAYVYGMKLEKGSVATDWSLNPEDQATQSQITQLSGEIDLRVTKGDLVDQINIQAGNTLISSSGQLILSGNSVLLDSVNPVVMKSANIGNLAVGTAQIANGAITNAQIGSLAVDTANIKDAAISSAKIANLAVGTAQIGNGAITTAKIGNLAVGTAQIANGAITNAQIGSLAVDTANIKDAAISSAKIANLAVGTAQIGNGAITTAKIGNLAVGTAQIANAAITDAQVGNVSANKLTAGTIDFNMITGKNINASNITTGTLSTDRLNVGKLSALSANLGDVTTGSLKGVDIVANTFSTPNGSFTTDSNGAVVASNLTIRGVTNLVYNAALLGGSGSSIPGWGISNNGTCWAGNLHDGVPSIGFNASTGAGVWAIFAQTKLHPLNGDVYQPFSASVWFKEYGSDTSLQYQFTLAFFDSNGNRINGGFTGQTWNGIGSGQDWRYITINNVTPPSNAVSVGLQYWAYNGHGNACFSSPMLTQTAQATGYQPDTGNVINAGIINSSTINAGSIINDSNNTSNWYPFTVTPSGVASTTAFNSADALRTEMSGGGIRTMYRSVVSSGTQYEAYDGNFDGNMISLNSGFTNGKDMSFSQSVSGSQLTGQVTLSPLDGINLWGPTQSIHFSGLQMNGTGISFNSYGNIVADVGSTWWRVVDSSGNQIVNFGTAPGNNTTFPKPIFVDQVGAYSTSNGGALLLCDYKGTSQISLRNDGNPQVVSASIYNRTYSSGSTVTITSYGTMGRITSASKYKLDITKETSLSPANKLLSIDRSSWVDKESAERLADSKTKGTELSEPEINVSRHYGLIAEDLIKAGLDEFVIKGDNGQAEGIEYDRLWTVLIPKIRDLSNKQIDDRMTISRLEKEIENLKQEVSSK